ncbi:glycosyltransferase [Patescibacteria group bacterium]|nr:glycosyltransferase [Patescibacteria group bacterium]
MISKPLISVVIPAYNEEKYLPDCLESLDNQTLPREKYEVIVVDNNSTDKTAEVAQRYGSRLIGCQVQGVSASRAVGSAAAQGEIITGTDADTRVVNNWLEVILEAFEDSEVVALTGPVVPKEGATLAQRAAFGVGQKIYWLVGKLWRKTYLYGMNFAVRRSAYENAGGFDPNLRAGEDTDLTERVSKFGNIKYDRRMKVYTSTRRLEEGYLKSFARYSWNFILLKLGKKPPGFSNYR